MNPELLVNINAGGIFFSFGEMVASPTSQEYVGRIAPSDKKALYMGSYFVAVVLDSLFGGILSGELYGHFARDLQRPDLMWMSFGGIMLFTAIAFMLYNQFALPRRRSGTLMDCAEACGRWARGGTMQREGRPHRKWWGCSVEDVQRVLRELRLAEQLREGTESMLPSWQHSGFHVHAGEPVLPDDTERLEHLARTIIRAPIRLDAIASLDAARLVVRTSPDPQAGSQRLELDELERIRRLCAQCPNFNPVEMRLVSVIQVPMVIDGILGQLQRIGGTDPYEGTAQRGPPAGRARQLEAHRLSTNARTCGRC